MDADLPPAIDPELLALLVCPETHQPLAWASGDLLRTLNQRIQAGELRRRDGTSLDRPLDAGLLRADGRCLYPVHEGIPDLLVGDRIDLEAGAP